MSTSPQLHWISRSGDIRNYSGHFRWEIALLGWCRKSHDKNMAALCVCFDESKSKFYSLRNKNLNPLKKRNICTQINFRQRFKKIFYCSVYEVISPRKLPSIYQWECRLLKVLYWMVKQYCVRHNFPLTKK